MDLGSVLGINLIPELLDGQFNVLIADDHLVDWARLDLTFETYCPEDCAPFYGDGTFGNGEVNIDDIVSVINAFGLTDSPCDVAPNNGDGTWGNDSVNIDDIVATINAFGECP